jgi:hypothetical protein
LPLIEAVSIGPEDVEVAPVPIDTTNPIPKIELDVYDRLSKIANTQEIEELKKHIEDINYDIQIADLMGDKETIKKLKQYRTRFKREHTKKSKAKNASKEESKEEYKDDVKNEDLRRNLLDNDEPVEQLLVGTSAPLLDIA